MFIGVEVRTVVIKYLINAFIFHQFKQIDSSLRQYDVIKKKRLKRKCVHVLNKIAAGVELVNHCCMHDGYAGNSKFSSNN